LAISEIIVTFRRLADQRRGGDLGVQAPHAGPAGCSSKVVDTLVFSVKKTGQRRGWRRQIQRRSPTRACPPSWTPPRGKSGLIPSWKRDWSSTEPP